MENKKIKQKGGDKKMKRKNIMGLIAMVAIAAAVMFAGCVEEETTTPPAETITPIPTLIPAATPKTTTMQASELILDLSDFPGNYSFKERSPRLKSDVSEEGIKLGWKGGYYVRYARIGENIFDVTVIEQLISLYPIENITKVLESPRESTENLTFEEIPCSGIGNKCKSWRITITDEFETQERYYEIQFIKMDVYEDFYMSGTSTDYELLVNLVKKAEAKIR